MTPDTKNELKKIFIKWFTDGYFLDDNTQTIKKEEYLIPKKSSVYYKNVNTEIIFPQYEIEVLPCLDSSKEIARLIRKPNIEFKNYIMSLNKYGSNNSYPSVDTDALIIWKKASLITIIEVGSIYRITLTTNNGNSNDNNYEDTLFNISKKDLEKSILIKLKELLKVQKDLIQYKEKANSTKNFSQTIRKSGFYFYDDILSYKGKIKKVSFSQDALDKIKKMKVNKINSGTCPYEYQEKISKLLGLDLEKSNKSISIDNGWGSYTYTFMAYSIYMSDLSEEDKNLVSYLWNRFKNISSRPNDRYLKLNKGYLGFVQNSGGYTHVS